VRGGKEGGGGNVEEQEKGEDEACNTVPLLAVDLSARSIRWRKRRSREFHGDYHTRTILQFSLALSPRNNVFEPRIPRCVRARRKMGWTDDAIIDEYGRQTHFSSIILSLINYHLSKFFLIARCLFAMK